MSRIVGFFALYYTEWLWDNGGYTSLMQEDLYSMLDDALHGCNQCGHHFIALPEVLKRKYQTDNGCRKCFPKEGGQHAWSEEKYKTVLSDVHHGRIVLLGTYKNQNTKALHECTQCGHTWLPYPGSIISGHGCTVCGMRKAASTSAKHKTVNIAGVDFTVQGFEPAAISWIISNRNISPNEIVTAASGAPVIDYADYAGRMRKHFPDLYIPSRNLLVEVKSAYTFKKILKLTNSNGKRPKKQALSILHL